MMGVGGVGRVARPVLLAALAAALLATGAAIPSARADEAEGRRRFQKGSELYDKGRYLEAAREFEAGYGSAPKPRFLLNIGHAYRRANELQRAKDAYQQFLRAEPEFPKRGEVEGYIKSIDDALQAGAPATPPPPQPSQATSSSGSASAASAAAPALVDPTPPPRLLEPVPERQPEAPPAFLRAKRSPYAEEAQRRDDQPIYRKPWFWVVVGVVVAGSVATGVVLLRPSASTCQADLCIREPR